MADNASADLPDPQEFTDPSPCPAIDTDLAILCDALQAHQVTLIVVRYDGSGDSGSVEEVAFEPDVSLPEGIKDRIREVAGGYCPDGYANSEGGYGTLTVYLALGLAALEHYDRFEDTEAIVTAPVSLPRALRRRLSRLGVTAVTAHFDGYGDSGQIEEIDVEPDSVELGDKLSDTLERFLLDQLPAGWEINEGSFGDFTVDVAADQVTLDASWRMEQESDAQVTRWQWRQ